MIGGDRFVQNLTEAQQKLHATQRYSRGWSDIDMWNFDCLIADLIVAACDHYMSDTSTGHPWRLDGKEWYDILAEIKEGFSRDEDGVPTPPKSAWKLLRKHFHSFWD